MVFHKEDDFRSLKPILLGTEPRGRGLTKYVWSYTQKRHLLMEVPARLHCKMG